MEFSVFVIILVVSILLITTARRMHKTFERERTRREIAAYVAEGAMTPEEGERLMAAGEKPGE
jgi:hypothetical protein